MKLILIARVSDVEQRKALPAQKLRLTQYAAGIDPQAEYYEFDESAHKDTRQKFALLVEHIKSQKEPCAVVFDKIDRYTRDSSQEEVRALNVLVKSGKIQLHFPSDNLYIDKKSPAADLFRLGIGMALAKYYSDSIRDNVQRRFAQLLADKTWIGYSPCGYLNVHKGTITKPIKSIEVDSLRAPFIIKMFEKRSTGMSYGAITKLVNDEGMAGKSGRPMTKANTERILHNPFYHGIMVYNGKQYPHKYPPLITKELYDRCLLVREQRHKNRTAYKSLPFIFSDIVKCKDCGCSFGSYVSHNNVYLKCTKSKKSVNCSNINVAQKLVMPQIQEVLESIRLSDDDFELFVNTIRNRHGNQQEYLEKTIADTRQEYDNISSQLKALTYERLESVKTGKGISTDLFDEIVEELTNKQQILNRKLVSLTNANKSFLTTASHLLDLGQNANKLFNQADSATKNQILKIVAANIELYDKRVSFTLSDPYNAFSLLNRNYEDDSKNDLWCDKLSNQLTSRAIELEQNVSFQELVDSLSLNGELLSV